MILAAAAAARNEKAPLPPDLRLAFQCRDWACLPRPGGALDQPAGLLTRMTTALNVYQAVKAWGRSTNWVLFAERNPELMKVVNDVLKLEKAHAKLPG